MSKKKIFLLFLLAFTGGFMLREIFVGLSNNTDLQIKEGEITGEAIKSVLDKGGNAFEAVKIEAPQKVIRGSPLEILVYLRALKQAYGTYKLVVYLRPESGGERIKLGRLKFNAPGNWLLNESIKMGPFQAPVPEGLALGVYNIEVSMVREDNEKDELIRRGYAQPKIEIITYNK